MKKQTVKHMVRLLSLLLVASFVLTGCAQTGNTDPTTTDPTTTTAAGGETTATAGTGGPDVTATTGGGSGETQVVGTTEVYHSGDNGFTPAKVPTVTTTKRTVKTTAASKVKPVIKPTKPDAGALTFKSKPISGKAKKITGFKVLTKTPKARKLLEFELDMPKGLPKDVNPYWTDEVSVQIDMKSSTGKKISTYGFFYEEYSFLTTGQLNKRTDKPGCFRIRVSPKEEGTWDFTVTLKIANKKVDTLTAYVNVAANSQGSKIIGVEPVRKQNFQHANGDVYIAVGENIAWGWPIETSTKAGQYIGRQMKYCSEYGANYARVWSAIDGGMTIRNTVKTFNPAASAMWDYLYEKAEEYGVYISMVLFSHGEMSDREALPEHGWDRSVWYKDTIYPRQYKGYVSNATEFFTDDKTYESVKNYYRYVLARWGYSENVMSWELFNEVDITDAGAANMLDEIRGWIKNSAEYLRANDPYNHMVSCSTASYNSTLSTYNVMDFIYYHCYNYTNLEMIARLQKEQWQIYRKPVLFGEVGHTGSLATLAGGAITKELVNFHQQNWIGVMGGGAGTAMTWAWEGIEKYEGYWDFQIVSEIAKEIPWEDPNMFMYNTSSAEPSNAQIKAMGYRGEDYAYLWFYDDQYKHYNRVITTFKNETAQLKLKNGTYHVRWINTWTGVSIKKETIQVKNGVTVLKMPKWEKDVAVAITTY